MPFDPDAYLNGQAQPGDGQDTNAGNAATLTAPPPATPAANFDPDAFLASRSVAGFDPDKYLSDIPVGDPSVPATPAAPLVNQLINAGRELRGGTAAGVLGIGEGFERSMAGQEAGTPQSITAGIDKQIADRQTALANFNALPDSLQQTADISRQKANVQQELANLQAQRQNPRLALPPGTNPAFLTPEYQRQRDERTAAAGQSADLLQSAKEDAGTMFGQDPAQKNTTLARVSRSAGETVPLLAASTLPGGVVAAAGIAGLQAKASAYDSYLADAVKAGKVDASGQPTADAKAEAQQYSDATGLRTVPEMAAYLGAGHVAAGVVSKLLSPEAPAAVRALAQGAAAYVSNAAAGTANQVVEQVATGQPIDASYSLERGVQDAMFSAHPALHAYGEARSVAGAPGDEQNVGSGSSDDTPGNATSPAEVASSATSADTTNFDPDAYLAATDPDRQPVPPTYAAGDTPQERANNFLDVDGEAMPSAVHFAPDETVPASLDALPRVAMPDGSTMVYDPETHQPQDFDTEDGGASPQDVGNSEPIAQSASATPDEEDDGQAQIKPADKFTTNNELVDENVDADPLHDVDLEAEDPTAEEQARRVYEAELMAQGQEGVEQSGPELLQAVKDFGGVNPDDPVFAGEVKNLRDASKPAALAGVPGVFNIFRKAAGGLDALTGHLQSLGFPVDTPADTLDLLQQRLGQRKPIYGSYVRAEAQSGMAGAEAYARTQRPALPRTPEELRPLQQRWFDALQRLSPDTALRLEVVHQQALESLWPNGAPRTEDGGIPHAANLNDTIYLSADALRDNAPQVNRVNLLHEVAHSYERSLPVSERQALRAQWKEEMASQRSPLHDEAGNFHPEVDPRAATDFSEWLAERVAWENEGHFAGQIDPQAGGPQSAVARFVAGLRALVLRTWQAVRPDMHPSELSARFRDWLSAGGRREENLGFDSSPEDARFAQRQTLEEQGYRPAAPEERKRLGIPPAWTDVHVATDPNARRVAVGKDGKGRTQSRYSIAHTSEAMARKFERGTVFNQALPSIMARVRESLASGKGREEAAVLRLIRQTGFRNGGDEDTGAKVKAYGASNLRAEHVAFDGDTTHFDFTGKLGVRQQHSLTDPEITADLRARAAKGGPLFDTTDAKVRDFLKQSGDFKVHDFRTWNATDLAAKEAQNTPTPTTAEEYWNERDRIGDLAAKKLGDTRKIVLESYVNPAVFEPWKTRLGITDENRPKRQSKARAQEGNTSNVTRGGEPAADERFLRDDQLSGRPTAGGQAAAALRPARGLARNGGLSDEHAATLDETLAQTRPAFERLGFPVRETAHGEGAGLGPGFSDHADTHLGVDRPALTRSLAESGLEGPAAHRYITDTIGEELRHAADIADARERWQSEGAKGEFTDFYQQDKARLLQSIQGDMDGLSPASREVAMGAILDGWNLYHDPFDQGDGPRFDNVAVLFSHLEDHPEQVPGFMAETLRQLMQARESNHALTTETGYLSVLDHFRAFVDRMLGRLRELARNPQTYSLALADTISRLERAATGTPEPGDPQATVRQTVRGLRGSVESREAKDRIVAGKDAAENRAGMIARQAANGVRLDFGTVRERSNPNSRASKDLAAMPFVIEAGGKRAEVAADLAKVRASTDPELAAKYAPVVQHAYDNFARLDGLKANYEAITAKQRAIERRHGIDSGEVKNYVTRKLDLPEHQRNLEPVVLGGVPGGASMGSRYFAKGRDFAKLADAIKEGYPPQSTNLADLLEHRIRTGQQLVQQAKLFNELRATKAPGDPAGRTIVGQLETHTTPSGKTELRIPAGYDLVPAGGGKSLIVQRQYSGLFGALYGDSAIRNSTPGRLILKYAALAKHGTLVFDTFHACRMFAKELSYGYQAGYRRGVSLLEYGDKDLARAVASGDIKQSQADYARAQRPQAEALIQAGLNVGKVSDNLAGQVHGLIEKLPGVGPGLAKFNDWVFNKVSRGALLQTALTNYGRNLSRFPELGPEGAARRTAREMNEVFGNLGSQGLFKSATMRDLARTVLLAPQWTESQLRAEGRGLGQIARIPLDAARGRFRVGTVAQGMASNVLALLAANQIVNYLSRGKSTFQNPEKDHKLDAWIPGGAHGFWFSPFEIAAENLHSLLHYRDQGSGLVGAAGRLAANKLSPLARGAAEVVTGKNYLGQPFATTGQRIRAGLVDGLPSPLPLSAFLEKDPRGVAGSGPVHDLRSAADKILSPLGYRVNRQAGSLEHQAIQMAGVKTTPAQSAEARTYELAKPFSKRGESGGQLPPSPYTELRHALANNDAQGAQDEIRALVRGGKTVAQIAKGMGIHADGSIPPKLYTGAHETEQVMLRNLTPEMQDTYHAAQNEHRAMATRFRQVRAAMDQSDLRVPAGAR